MRGSSHVQQTRKPGTMLCCDSWLRPNASSNRLRACSGLLRKQLYPLGKGNYPTLVQKHFNGAEPFRHLIIIPFQPNWQSCPDSD